MNKYRFVVFALLLAFLLAGCGSAAPEQTLPTSAPVSTAIPAPTLIPTPTTPLAILIVPEDMDQELSDQYQALVYNLAQGSGMRFQVRNRLTPEALAFGPTLKVVIALPPAPGLAELVTAAPQTQFLAVNIPEVTAGGNLSVLSNTSRPDISAFLAG
ncbi:MAG: hypothetical protein L3J16_03400, partial [Anaerolineales bacterium]|nr:hypothetical protein [Anaerolineales bacterium]